MTMELIPAIDLKEGRCVRLFKGDFAAETVYSHDPSEILQRYRALGARRIHVVDLDGAKDGTQTNRDVILKLAADSSIKLQVGGGLRSLARVQSLLDSGVERAVIGSVAINSPDEVIAWLEQMDPTRI